MYNQKIKLQQNIEAIKIAFGKQEYNIDKLKLFSGWGGIKAILNNPLNDEDWKILSDVAVREDVKELHHLLKSVMPEKDYKKSIDSIKSAILTSFYTPDIIVKTFYKVLKQYMYVDKFYDPSSGAGVFFTSSQEIMNINSATLYEKDLITGKVLQSITKNSTIIVDVQIKPFEESSHSENGIYSLVATNVPFGQIKIYDPKFKDSNIVGKIHNYFVAKSIDKLKEGGVLAIIISDAFLNTVSNKSIRQYLFKKCDFISLVVMPDNLMKDTGNTEAPSHFLVVQKNSTKSCLSPEEELLVESSFVNASGGKYAMNYWLQDYDNSSRVTIATGVSYGKNQYGKPAIEIHWSAPINEIAEPFRQILQRDFSQRFLKEKTLVETFQELGEIMGATLQNITFDNSPLDKEELDKELLDHYGEENKPEHNIADLLPKYVPFKDNIIVEYEKDNNS